MTIKAAAPRHAAPDRHAHGHPVSAAAAAAAPAFYPYLYALRAACALHALAAFLYPDAAPLASTAPLQLPFLLFLAGFTLALPHHSPPARNPPRFYAARYAKVLPPFCTSVLLHAALFAFSPRPLRSAALQLVALSPFLPQRLTFPPSDAPLPLPNLLPALIISYLLFPTLQDMLPRRDTPHTRHHHIVLLALYAATAMNASWLVSLGPPLRAAYLPDLTAFIPFLLPLPPFILGVAFALARPAPPSQSTPRAAPPLSHRLARLFATIALLLLSLTLAAALLHAPAPLAVPAFLPVWAVTGLFLPVLALAADAAASMTMPNHSTRPANRVSRLLAAAAAADLSIFCVVPLVMRALSASLCETSNLSTAVCRPPSYALPPVVPLPALGSSVLASTALDGPRVAPSLLPLAIAVACAAHYALLQPMSTVLFRIFHHLADAASNRGPGDVSMSSPSSSPAPWRDGRDDGRVARFCKRALYYAAAALFLIGMFRLSLPFAETLVQPPLNVWCALTKHPDACTRALSPHPPLLSRMLAALRWLVVLTLPPMLFNLTGHLAFPRAVWQHLPTVAHMLATGADDCAQHLEDGVGTADRIAAAARGNEANEQGRGFRELSVNFVMYIRYVTRGTSPGLVTRNAARAAHVLSAAGLPASMWRVEVVTDRSVGLTSSARDDAQVYEIVVPPSYRTSTGALFKARALNYAIEASRARDCDWIVHLDEETRFDVDTVRAMLYHCAGETHDWLIAKRRRWPRIGQGPILYGRVGASTNATGGTGSRTAGYGASDTGGESESGADEVNWVTTLADSGRVADDMGRYRLQYECNEVWTGMHGSFVVACNVVERAVTFDHGLEGSIAEDAFFALEARARGVRFAWIDALMFEQSPFTVKDFVRQRARWLVGGVRVVGCGRLPWRVRWIMLLLTGIWSLMPVVYVALLAAIFVGGGAASFDGDGLFHVVTAVLTTGSLWNYAMGFFVTFRPCSIGWVRFGVLLYAQVALAPVFGMMEVAAVSYALCNFRRLAVGFHVVQKDVQKEAPKEGPKGGVAEAGGVHDEQTPLLRR